MKKHLFLLLFIVICYSGTLHAQFDPRPQIQKPVTDAESLGKFGDIPIDLFTGRVNVDIPIYTVKYYDIEVPVSISYHGGGIKVSDERGSVGLGWTLNVGGVVNRTVCGMPDEFIDSNRAAGFGQLNNLKLPNTLNKFTDFIDIIKRLNSERNPMTLASPFTPAQLYVTDWIYKYGDMYDNGQFDTAQDNYSFNVQGLSGAFVHKDIHEAILQSNDGVTVWRPNSVSYTITDANGYVYQFQDMDKRIYFYK
jgi:hypothetical protein